MGKVRQRAQILACGECGAEADAPCVHKKTGKPLGGFHRTRVWGAKQDVLNEEVRLIEGESEDEFWKWVDRWFGLDPDDQYHGEF